MIREKIIDVIQSCTNNPSVHLLQPRDPSHGDYAVHLQQLTSHGEKISADGLMQHLKSEKEIDDVTQIGSFINIRISNSSLEEHLLDLYAHEPKLVPNTMKPQKIVFEFGQPNTHKLPHIGHLFSYMYGNSMARLLHAIGHHVIKANYQGDVGLHVAKCLYVVQQKKDEMENLENLADKVQFLQTCYQEGSALYDDPDHASKIQEINSQLYEENSPIQALWTETRQWSLDYYEQFEESLGIEFDKHYFESQTARAGFELVQSHLGTVFEESDEAIVYHGEEDGLHTRVFITRYKTPTYEAKDLGLAQMKYQDWHADRYIIATAVEQNEYWNVVTKAIEKTIPDLTGKIEHIGYGMIELVAGKMSSRTGNILSAMGLLDLVTKSVSEQFTFKNEDSEQAVKQIAQAAIKYAFLRSEARKNITFDVKESISLQGNSAPYLLYAYARIQSLIEKSKSIVVPTSYTWNDEEMSLLRMLIKYQEMVIEAATKASPHILCTYLFALTKAFNDLYEKHSILSPEENLKAQRLILITAVSKTVKHGLSLLGIETLNSL